MKWKGLVIAGNYHEYQNFIFTEKYNPQEYIYVNDMNWMGIHNVPIIKVGTWYMRKDLPIKKIELIVGGKDEEDV